jgi:hypothetical protein
LLFLRALPSIRTDQQSPAEKSSQVGWMWIEFDAGDFAKGPPLISSIYLAEVRDGKITRLRMSPGAPQR